MILPSFDCCFQTDRTQEEIRVILESVTSTCKNGFSTGKNRDFIGEIQDLEFRITPNLWYRNSFVPVIKGRIEPDGKKWKVYIMMRMHPFVSVFSVFWLCGVFFGFLCGILCLFTEGIGSALPLIGITGSMIILDQIIMRIGFFRPAKNSMQRLRELLSGSRTDG